MASTQRNNALRRMKYGQCIYHYLGRQQSKGEWKDISSCARGEHGTCAFDEYGTHQHEFINRQGINIITGPDVPPIQMSLDDAIRNRHHHKYAFTIKHFHGMFARAASHLHEEAVDATTQNNQQLHDKQRQLDDTQRQLVKVVAHPVRQLPDAWLHVIMYNACILCIQKVINALDLWRTVVDVEALPCERSRSGYMKYNPIWYAINMLANVNVCCCKTITTQLTRPDPALKKYIEAVKFDLSYDSKITGSIKVDFTACTVTGTRTPFSAANIIRIIVQKYKHRQPMDSGEDMLGCLVKAAPCVAEFLFKFGADWNSAMTFLFSQCSEDNLAKLRDTGTFGDDPLFASLPESMKAAATTSSQNWKADHASVIRRMCDIMDFTPTVLHVPSR